MAARRITVGVDGSDGGRRALTWALAHAMATGAEVDVVTTFHYEGSVVPDHIPSPRAARRSHEAWEHQQRDIEAALAALSPTPRVHRVVVPAPHAAVALVRAARSSEMLVLGSHGHGRVESALLGTVSADCVRSATCPVVIVPSRWAPLESEHEVGKSATAGVESSRPDRARSNDN